MKGLLAIQSIKEGPYVRMFLLFKPHKLKEFLSVVSDNEEKYLELYKDYNMSCECKTHTWSLELKEVCVTNVDSDLHHLTLTFLTESEDIADNIRELLMNDIKRRRPFSQSTITIKFTKDKKEFIYKPREAFN
jgi:hypothetical protein